MADNFFDNIFDDPVAQGPAPARGQAPNPFDNFPVASAPSTGGKQTWTPASQLASLNKNAMADQIARNQNVGGGQPTAAKYDAAVDNMFDDVFPGFDNPAPTAGVGKSMFAGAISNSPVQQPLAPVVNPDDIQADDLDWLFDNDVKQADEEGSSGEDNDAQQEADPNTMSFGDLAGQNRTVAEPKPKPKSNAVRRASFRAAQRRAGNNTAEQKSSISKKKSLGAKEDREIEALERAEKRGKLTKEGKRRLSMKTQSFREVQPKAGQGRKLRKMASIGTLMPAFRIDQPDALRDFLTAPVPMELSPAHCFIHRLTDANGKYVYALYLDRSKSRKGKKFVMFARDRSGFMSRGVNVMMSMTVEGQRKEPAFVGKVRGNLDNTYFRVFDNGLAPRKARGRMEVRKELASIRYTVSRKHPRTMDTLVPAVHGKGHGAKPVVCRPMKDSESLENVYKAQDLMSGALNKAKVSNLPNKTPQWDARRQCHTLDFKGRAKLSSVKNFILFEQGDRQQRDWLLSGKLSGSSAGDGDVVKQDSKFSCDVSFPLSIVQGFGICLSAMYARHDTYI